MPLDAFQTTDSTDDASPVVAGDSYPAMQSVIVDTAATGDYVDKYGRPAANDAAVSVRIPNGDASAVISAGAEITVTEFALVEIITGESSSASFIQTPVNEFYVASGLANNAGSPHNLGSFVCNRTGVYRFLTTERTNNNQVWANIGTAVGASNIWNGNDYRIDDGSGNGHDVTRLINLTSGTRYYVSGIGGGGTVGTVSVEIRWAATEPTFTPEPPLPESMHITSVSGNQTGNGFTTNGVYRSNNTGPLNGTGLGNWTWRVKATRIGDWIQHMYWNDTANIAFRESFDGGATWTSWAA